MWSDGPSFGLRVTGENDPGEGEAFRHAFRFEAAGGEPGMACAAVRGFHEAAGAARDPRLRLPPRLVLRGPNVSLDAWLRAWAEDAEHIRRSLRIEREFDGHAVTVVATLASYGYGIETSLAVESVCEADALAMIRSGVHPKAIIDAVLGRDA